MLVYKAGFQLERDTFRDWAAYEIWEDQIFDYLLEFYRADGRVSQEDYAHFRDAKPEDDR